ncbi:methylenetetrahydrofolate reductase [NAD(P)H] [Catenisphaera adipataccumulans]|jgi:methylenetetrahydrofolate reductase (NADPH)|uniref:Methylenetetrahydrofolate reductase n=1 Tax=Catenisphaera adipataccumulans TaxID=700500 RepID=A0A7W8FW96_9FIRM|nr:methylenetetrahydrofolate reductase [NAD(P)H] [Catenisphaera adipataccumulans]MBB5183011.1 methylenetetrahydrofolate reductase (NADPH) [Catenisphaera adipataccumulans]
MKIIDILNQDQVTLSFEVFPPKKADTYDVVEQAARAIASLHPDFMSITYGAGGGTSQYTADLAADLHDRMGVEVLPHLTCVSSDRAHVHKMIKTYQEKGIENIMALRGDLPKDGHRSQDYTYAYELIQDIKAQGDFCIGGACYPEGHIECAHKADDIQHLKNKVEAGCDFLTTQMFFDNTIFYNFLYRIREAGIQVPVLAGIMPITNPRQLQRSVQMSGTNVPERFRAIVDYFGDDPKAMEQAGIIYASEQIIDLIANGIKHIHVYSMNKPEVAAAIQANISAMLRS